MKNKKNLLIYGTAIITFLVFFTIFASPAKVDLQTVNNTELSSNPSQNTTETPSQTPLEEYYPITKVIDGDTISVNINGTIETLRLIGINSPESVDPRKPVECFGIEASNKAKELLTNKKVRLKNDLTQGEKDKYGRLLRYVWMEDGTFFNKKMISDGYAFEYTYNTPYKYQSEFKQAELEAKTAKKGLWAYNVCVQESPTPSPNNQNTANTGSIICTYNAYNCTDFSTHIEAQQVFETCGGINNDVHKLDTDKDGIACESLP